MDFNTPILFLVFNRPETAHQVFEAIKKQRPKYLFVAADGARRDKEGEAAKCEEVRKLILENINWDCEVKTLLRNENLGCGLAVSQAIKWFFEQVEEGIILEDDCLPSDSFFSFCSVLLERYRNDEKVFMIGGFSLLPENTKSKDDYFFNTFGGIWGWATWKRSWSLYEYKTDQYKPNAFDKITHKKVREYYRKTFELERSGALSTWDIQLLYTSLKANSLSIVPIKNMIKNIGFSGTHSNNSISLSQNRKTYNLDSENIKHPAKVTLNRRLSRLYDLRIEWVLNNGVNMHWTAWLIRLIKRKLS